MEQWKSLANDKGLGFPIGKPAQAKLIRDTINALKLREAEGMVQ
jgi:hypothetical protein